MNTERKLKTLPE